MHAEVKHLPKVHAEQEKTCRTSSDKGKVGFMDLPKDAMLLLSVVNTKLRDDYPSLDALCEDMNAEKEAIEETLKKIDYEYDEELNRFV